MKKNQVLIFFLVISSLFGCTPYKYLHQYEKIDHKLIETQSNPSLLINSINLLSDDGQKLTVNEEFKNTCLDVLKRSGSFEIVSFNQRDILDNKDYLVIDIDVKEDINNYVLGNALKGFILGGSLFLTYPMIYLKYGYKLDLKGEVRRVVDGSIFEVHSSNYNILKRKYFCTESSLFSKVHNKCFEELAYQIILHK